MELVVMCYMKKNKTIISLVIIAVLAVLTIALFIWNLIKVSPNFDKDGWKIKNDEDGKSFINAIVNSNSIKEKQNYYLDEDITVNVEKLPQDDIIFYGNLNGNGHTITLTTEQEESYMEKPIFSKIVKGASVSRVKFILDEKVTLGSLSSERDTCLLANFNYGSINNCYFEVYKQCIGTNCINAATIVNYNFKEMSTICLKLKEIIAADNTTRNWKCHFGAVATMNYGNVEKIFADINFNEDENKLDVFRIDYNNQFVGYLFSMEEEKAKTSDIYLFSENSQDTDLPFWLKACDTKNSNYNQKKYDDITDSYFLELKEKGIWNSYWQLDAPGIFPTLLINSK